MSFAPAVGCGVGCVVGAETLSETTGVWVKTRFYRDGDFLCATVYSVAAGEPKVVELRVDLRPITRAIMRAHAKLHQNALDRASVRGQTVAPSVVGWSLGKMWKGAKKAAASIGRMKLVKGVVGVTKAIAKGAKSVVKSKVFGAVLGVAAVFPLTAPFAAPALGAYAAANAAIKGVEVGAKVVKTAQSASSTITRGQRLERQVAANKSQTKATVASAGARMSPAERSKVAARARAAGRLQLNAQGKATVAASLASAPAGAARSAVAARLATRLKELAEVRQRAVLAKSLPPKAGAAVAATTRLELAAAPVIAQARAVRKKLASPAVQSKLLALRAQGSRAESLLAGVQKAAATGSLDAQKSAVIVNLVARNRARIQGMSQANAGGLPGIVITSQGKLERGRFRVQASAGGKNVLYQGPGKPRERGAFAAVVSGRSTVGHFAPLTGAFAPLTGAFAPLTGAFAPLTGSMPELVGRGIAGCYAVNGDLPLDGIRVSAPGANSYGIGPYEAEDIAGCGGNCGCASCA